MSDKHQHSGAGAGTGTGAGKGNRSGNGDEACQSHPDCSSLIVCLKASFTSSMDCSSG
jgi:hypothetical protein